MGKLKLLQGYADTLAMGSFKLMLFLITALMSAGANEALASSKTICESVKKVEAQIASKRSLAASDPSRTDSLTREISVLDSRRIELDMDCETAKQKDITDKAACDNKVAASQGSAGEEKAVWKWDPDSNTCEDLSKNVKTTGSSDECGNASVFKGQLRGQACKETMNTVKDVASQNEALTASTTAITTVYSSAQSMQATGAQGDAQERQKKIMQALAISKIATGGLALTNAMRLKNAASDAEDASSSISVASKDLRAHCDGLIAAAPSGARMSMDQCFYQNAQKFRIDPTEAERANFERMSSASSQSQEQADKANNAAKAAMVQGMADALVGVQALQLANQASANAAAAG
ncbi:MAG: hypothetical protein EOP11_25535, partial [Proteobacteria bacterium]